MIVSIDVGRKNLALCGLAHGGCRSGKEDVIRQWTVTACDPTPAGIAAVLQGLAWCLDCTEVVVERQPPKNPTMCRLQHYIEMFFAMHGKPVTVQDAKHKLAFAASTAWWPEDQATSWTYHARKKLAVATAAGFLEGTPQPSELKDLFRQSRKKDDLADSLLQAQAFAHNVLPLRNAAAERPAKPRKPTAKQLESRKFTKAHLAWFFRGVPRHRAAGVVVAHKLERAMAKEFGTVEAGLDALVDAHVDAPVDAPVDALSS